MVGKFFWILPAIAAVASAREILVRDFQNLNILFEKPFQHKPYIFENKILEAIYKLKNFLQNGDPKNGIPAVDPFFLPFKDFDFIIKDTALAGYLQNVTFAGFSTFELDTVELKLVPLHFKLEVRLDKFQIDGRYKLQGKILNSPVNGIGDFISETWNLTLCLYLSLTTLNDSFQIKDYIFEFKTLSVMLNYTNELISDQFQVLDEDLILFVLDQMQEKYVPPIFDTVKILLNRFLLGYSIADVLSFIIELLKMNEWGSMPSGDL